MNGKLYCLKLLRDEQNIQGKGKIRKAYKISKVLIDTERFSVTSWSRKSRSESQIGYFEKSLDTLHECKEVLEKETESHSIFMFRLGQAYLQQQKYEQSLQAFEKCSSLRTNCINTKISIPQVIFRLGRLDEASEKMKILLPSLTQPEQQIIAYSLLLQVSHQQSDTPNVEKYIDLVLELNQTDLMALIYKSDLILSSQKNNPTETIDKCIDTLKLCRKQLYENGNQFTRLTFEDLVSILNKYENQIKDFV